MSSTYATLFAPRPAADATSKPDKGSIGEAQATDALICRLETQGKNPVNVIPEKNSNASGTDFGIVTDEGETWSGDNKDMANPSFSSYGLDKPVGVQAVKAGVPPETPKGEDYAAQVLNAAAQTDLPEPALNSHFRSGTTREPSYEMDEERFSFYDDMPEEPLTQQGTVWDYTQTEVGAELKARLDAKADYVVATTTDAPLGETSAATMTDTGIVYFHVKEPPALSGPPNETIHDEAPAGSVESDAGASGVAAGASFSGGGGTVDTGADIGGSVVGSGGAGETSFIANYTASTPVDASPSVELAPSPPPSVCT